MPRDINRILIEAAVKKALKDMEESPKRAARNLVDLGADFSGGRFQKRFLGVAQKMLCNEDSAYYELITDMITHVDREILLEFGINLGYNSCTRGAAKIRSIEAQRNFNIPWSLSLVIEEKELEEKGDVYASLLEQGTALGIYTYLLFLQSGDPKRLFSLVKGRPDCAFVVFLKGVQVTKEYREMAGAVKNVMTAVCGEEAMEEACGALRKNGLLYGVYGKYSQGNKDGILNGSWLAAMKKGKPYFAFLAAKEDCTDQTRREVYEYVLTVRNSQSQPVVLMDLKQDTLTIDGIISDGICMAAFDPKGQLHTNEGMKEGEQYNIFQNSLESILQDAMKIQD